MIFKKEEKKLTKEAIFFGGIKGFVIILLTGFLIMTGLTFGDFLLDALLYFLHHLTNDAYPIDPEPLLNVVK